MRCAPDGGGGGKQKGGVGRLFSDRLNYFDKNPPFHLDTSHYNRENSTIPKFPFIIAFKYFMHFPGSTSLLYC